MQRHNTYRANKFVNLIYINATGSVSAVHLAMATSRDNRISYTPSKVNSVLRSCGSTQYMYKWEDSPTFCTTIDHHGVIGPRGFQQMQSFPAKINIIRLEIRMLSIFELEFNAYKYVRVVWSSAEALHVCAVMSQM